MKTSEGQLHLIHPEVALCAMLDAEEVAGHVEALYGTARGRIALWFMPRRTRLGLCQCMRNAETYYKRNRELMDPKPDPRTRPNVDGVSLAFLRDSLRKRQGRRS